MHLHVLPPSPRAIKVLAAKNYLGLHCEIRVLDYFSADQSQPAFAKLNPNRRMPVLEDNGWVLWESNAILFYLTTKKPEAGLWPGGARDQADVIRWLAWEGSHWDPAWDIIITERLKKQVFITRDSGRRTEGRTSAPQVPDTERLAEGERYLHELAAVLDSHLEGRSWVAGNTLTIADFALAAWIPSSAPAGFPLSQFKAIASWYDRVQLLPGWRGAIAPLGSMRTPA